MGNSIKGMVVSIISLVIGIVLLLFYSNFVAAANTTALDANSLMVINAIPMFIALSLLVSAAAGIWSAITGFGGSGKRLS